MPRTLVHVSDLHFSASAGLQPEVVALRDALVDADVDHVLVTGDITDRGRYAEFELFAACFGRLLDAGRVTLVPGNHDRLGDDLLPQIMPGARVQVRIVPGLYIVRVDSTGPHNRNLLTGHGMLTEDDLDEIDRALEAAPRDHLRVLSMHHHPLPLPEETLPERLSTWLGWPNAAELAIGPRLVRRIHGHVDVFLHGHRHVPAAAHLPGGPTAPPRALSVFNAGCTPRLGHARVLTHRDGHLFGPPRWLTFRRATAVADTSRAARAPAARGAARGQDGTLLAIRG